MIPSAWRLFKTIDSFMKLINIYQMIRINKTGELCHINMFGKLSLKEGIINIQLMKRPAMTNNNTENKSYYCGLNNWTKSVMIVHTRSLIEPFVNKVSFKPINRTIRMYFNTKNPFATTNIRR